MEPFNIEDVFVLFQGHACIDEFIFGGFFIFCEFSFPFMVCHGRDGAVDGIPLNDGQTGTGEAGETSEDNKKRHNSGKNVKPDHYGAVLGFWHMISPIRIGGIIAFGS